MSIRLYIGNLPEEVTRQELEEVLGPSEEVVSLKVITDRKTGKCRGFGFLTVGTTEAADSFIEKFNGIEFKGITLRVEKAQPKAKTDRPEGEAPTESAVIVKNESVIIKSESVLARSENAIARTESAIVRNASGIVKGGAPTHADVADMAAVAAVTDVTDVTDTTDVTDVTDAAAPAPEAPVRTTPAVNISRPIRKQNKERQEQNRERQERSDSRRRERDGNRGDSNRDRQPQVVSSSDEAGQPDPRWADALLDIRRQLTKA